LKGKTYILILNRLHESSVGYILPTKMGLVPHFHEETTHENE